jgi:tetratricopeptide (TPR) repeat protein
MDPAIQQLLDESRALRHEDPQAMLALARQAVRAAYRLPQDQARERCESWAHYANALRVCNRFRESQGAFRQAWVAFGRIGDDPLLGARIHELEASLQEATGRFREADLSLERALVIRLGQHGDGAAIGACLVKRANVAGHAGDWAAAIRHLRAALDFPARDSVTACAVVHNLAWFLVDAGESDLALTVVLEHSAAAPPLSGLPLLRSRWLSARILAAMSRGDCSVAQMELSEVRDEFLALGLPFDAALAGLESLSLQATPDPSSLTALQQIFEALGVEREALAAQLLLNAARDERLDILAPRIVKALKALAATGKLNLRVA